MRVLLLTLFITLTTLFAQTFESSEKRTNIIELYSSQGCSSCPPADKWLNQFKQSNRLFKDFIPLAFHVTYWDFLGWKDDFGQKQFDQRQYQYSSIWGKQNVYTPQFVVDGQEYRTWFQYKGFPRFDIKMAGVLTATLNEQQVTLEYDASKLQDNKVFINTAILGFDYSKPIRRGENAGKILKHQFVVLGFKQLTSYIDRDLKITYDLPNYVEDDQPKALVVYLSDSNGQTIQAVGGYLE